MESALTLPLTVFLMLGTLQLFLMLQGRIMAEYAPQLRQYHYDPKKYRTYLEQLGITYPTVRKEAAAGAP